jgi:hypothetical protein
VGRSPTRRGSVRERKGGGTHLSAHDAVVLPAEPRGGRTTGCRCPYGLFRGRDSKGSNSTNNIERK